MSRNNRNAPRKTMGKNPLLDTAKFESTDTRTRMKIHMALDDERFETLHESGEDIRELVQEIHNRLFIDNGRKSIQTILTSHALKMTLLMTWMAIITAGLGGIAFKILEDKATEAVASTSSCKILKPEDR